jgi:methyl-accepting chemotaxis protein
MPELVELLKVMILRQDDTNAALRGLAADTNAALQGLAADVKGLAQRQDETNSTLRELAADVKELAGEVGGIRSDLRTAIARQNEHEARLTKLESAVFPPAPPRPARRPGARR